MRAWKRKWVIIEREMGGFESRMSRSAGQWSLEADDECRGRANRSTATAPGRLSRRRLRRRRRSSRRLPHASSGKSAPYCQRRQAQLTYRSRSSVDGSWQPTSQSLYTHHHRHRRRRRRHRCRPAVCSSEARLNSSWRMHRSRVYTVSGRSRRISKEDYNLLETLISTLRHILSDYYYCYRQEIRNCSYSVVDFRGDPLTDLHEIGREEGTKFCNDRP